MAKNIRAENPPLAGNEAERLAEVSAEAFRQMENCLYTSTMLFIWLRRVRFQHKVVVLAPIVLTALAGFGYFKEVLPAWSVALMGFLATLIPSVADALEIQTHVDALKSAAAEFKALQDRFRRLAKITVLTGADRAENELTELMDRLDVVRSTSITPPEKYYEKAREKIKRGDYDFTIDIKMREAIDTGTVKPLIEYK